ncbi:MAG: uracil-DNA glycosylase [Oscillospiraceae bacterium]|nr:uracil-DNA glycosylase [Oscillospiraceae bacterium]
MADWRTELGGWGDIAAPFLAEGWCRALTDRVEAAYEGDKPVYPPRADLFTALRLTPPERVRCVILGQDPYPGQGQAHGLAFSVRPGVAVPRSLNNMYRELESDLDIPPAKTGSLIPWAEEGVLLLNNVLTVYGGEANSHKGWGWEAFTARLLLALQDQPRPIAFLLWGKGAQTKGEAAKIMDSPYPRLVIETAHPSPLSARRGFFGSKPFSRVNQFLEEHGERPICWAVK